MLSGQPTVLYCCVRNWVNAAVNVSMTIVGIACGGDKVWPADAADTAAGWLQTVHMPLDYGCYGL